MYTIEEFDKVCDINIKSAFVCSKVAVDYLTETDKVEIQNGIRVNGIEELNQLIEDFE